MTEGIENALIFAGGMAFSLLWVWVAFMIGGRD